MEQKRKIIIPLGGSREAIPARDFDGATTAQAPLFDAEATLGARPVVPLAETQKSRHFPLLVLVVLLAISAGVAGGFAIGLYRSRQIQQSAAPNTTATTSINTDATAAQAPAAAQQLPVAIASEKTPEPERTTASNAPVERAVRDNKPKRDEEQVIPPVEVRERDKEKRDREDRDREEKIARDDERELKRQQRRERRRRAREMDDGNGDVNQQIERGARELNRIREIFEGQRP
jgi:hypothetical protein